AGRSLQILCLGEDAPPGTLPFTPAALTDASRRELHAHYAELGISADDIATVCWTSGTEGMPKGVPRSHNHWIAISHAHFHGAGIQRGERLLNPFPLINMAAIGGCFMSWLHSAGTLVLHHPLDLGVYLRQIATEKPHYAIAPPAVLNMLLKDEKLLASVDLSSLRCIGSGSAPLDPEMIAGYRDRFGIEVVNAFGSNEGVSLMSNATYARDPAHRARLFPALGRDDVQWDPPVPVHIRTRIIDPESGREITTAGVPGELQITGPTVFDGYFRAPQVTAQSFTADGWFRTGDLFELAGDGRELRFYRFVGRLKQLIVRGGMKIAPEELDNVLSQIPDVLEGAVAAYRDDILGERICAVIVPRPGTEPTLESVCAHFQRAGVAIFKHPERLRVVEQLPRNSVGKVIRGDLSRIATGGDGA
ncbi:MAG TPA: fatty acid--CoA ligase family protein, partial [Steroidobacteraceae bacterium]